MKAARDGERDYMRALEVLGADATAEQKAAVEAAAGPDKKHELYAAWKRKRDAYVKARKAVLRPMPREARAFFENRGSTTSRIELQARVEQSGLQDLAKLEEGGKAGKCPVCFASFN